MISLVCYLSILTAILVCIRACLCVLQGVHEQHIDEFLPMKLHCLLSFFLSLCLYSASLCEQLLPQYFNS